MHPSIYKGFIIAFFIFVATLFFIGLGETRTPLLFSFTLAYLLYPLIQKIENHGIKRLYAMLSVFSSTAIVCLIILFFTIPNLLHEGKELATSLPMIANKTIHNVQYISEELGYPLTINLDEFKNYVTQNIGKLSSSVLKAITLTLKNGAMGLSKWLILLMNLFLIPLFFFYLINDYEKINHEIKSFFPKTILNKVEFYIQQGNTILSGYIRGQLIVALIQALLYSTALSILGLKFGFIVGLMTGILCIIPYVGFTTGLITAIAITLAYSQGIGILLGVMIIFITMQFLEGFFLTPKLVGDKLGLSALSTMLVLIIGGNYLGLVGMLIAIPLTAILVRIMKDLKKELKYN